MEYWHLRVYSGLALSGSNYTRTQRRNYLSANILALMPGEAVKQSSHETVQASFILPAKNSPSMHIDSKSGFLGAEPLESNIVCWKHARRWIHECVATHTTCLKLTNSLQVPIKLVDCQSRTIVSYHKGQRYVALSYVWGARTGLTADDAKQLETSKALPAKIPRTIEDALKAVIYLGERYLWVDQYCISQYHAEGKQEQIGAMADIYGCALLTIVALGDNADAGLDGVTSVRKHCQPSVSVGDQKLVWAMPDLQQCLESSIWSTRAWTYQEALLSPRCLIVTKYQLFFVCGLGTVCETFPDLGCVQVRSACSWPENPINPSMLLPSKSREGAAFALLEQQLEEYRKRKLSYESDALNAFRGILAKSEVRSYWGLPLRVTSETPVKRRKRPAPRVEDQIMSPESGLVKGLLWHVDIYSTLGLRRSARQRRLGFPSWTWASTANAVFFYETHSLHWYAADDVVHAQVRLTSEHTHTVQNFNDVAALSANSIITEHGRCLLLTSYVASCMLRQRPSQHAPDVVECWVNAAFLRSRTVACRLDPEGYEELRINHGGFRDGGCDECECEAILMLGSRMYMWWMLIIRKSDVYVRLGVLLYSSSDGDWVWPLPPLEQTTIELH
jgi:Heterokaryon incompatibility protein (HET)